MFRQAHVQSPKRVRSASVAQRNLHTQEKNKNNITVCVLTHTSISDSKMSTWTEGSSPVAVQPPSVKAESVSCHSFLKKTSITSIYIEFSPHWSATLLAGKGWHNTKGISGCCGFSGRLGKRHVSFATGPSSTWLNTKKILRRPSKTTPCFCLDRKPLLC